MGLQDVVEETVGEVMAKCDALKRENEELRGTIKRLEREYYATAKAKFEARIAALEKENAELQAELDQLSRSVDGPIDRMQARIAKLEVVYVEAAKIVQLEHDALIEALRAVDAKE